MAPQKLRPKHGPKIRRVLLTMGPQTPPYGRRYRQRPMLQRQNIAYIYWGPQYARIISQSKKINISTRWCHTTQVKIVSTILEELPFGKGIWPAHAPDLHPIESLGSILKDSA